MKKFVFGLESVAKWRHTQSEQAQAELEKLHAKRNVLIAQLKQDEQCLLNPPEMAVCTGSDLQQLASFRTGLEHRVQQTKMAIIRQDAAINSQLQACMEAKRREKMLTNLRDRRFQAWQAESAKELENTASELFLASYVRRS